MTILDSEQIRNILPHREPVLLADSAETGSGQISTTFHVRPDMDIFKSHFPDDPVLPGFMVSEAMAQCAALLLLMDNEGSDLKPYLVSAERMRFIRPVRPGDILVCHASLAESQGTLFTFNVSAEVGSQASAKGVLTLTLK